MFNRTPKTRVILESSSTSIEKDYCCHAYSLGVHKDAEILSHHGEIFMDLKINGKLHSSPCIPHLAKKGLLKTVEGEENLKNGDIILYLNAKKELQHSGIYKDGQIVSKWGGRARDPDTDDLLIGDHLYIHNFDDVPDGYKANGEVFAMFVRIKEGVTPENIRNELLDFRSSLLKKGTFTKLPPS